MDHSQNVFPILDPSGIAGHKGFGSLRITVAISGRSNE